MTFGEIFIKGKLELYNNNLQISHPEIIDKKIINNKDSLHQVVYKQKKILKSETIHSLILEACTLLPEIGEWNVNFLKKYKSIPSFKESILSYCNHCGVINTVSDTITLAKSLTRALREGQLQRIREHRRRERRNSRHIRILLLLNHPFISTL